MFFVCFYFVICCLMFLCLFLVCFIFIYHVGIVAFPLVWLFAFCGVVIKLERMFVFEVVVFLLCCSYRDFITLRDVTYISTCHLF